MARVRVRFAPSPTGYLHVGNVHTALFAWLFARREGGAFVLRIEDTDRERSTPKYEQAILEDLTWLGLDWDEGPDKGGPYAPYRQSQCLDLYREEVERLLATGWAYPCYCTPEELTAERQRALEEGRPPRYSGRCRNLTPRERAVREEEGRRPVIRFRLPEEGEVTFTDLIRGEITFPLEGLDDFVLVRADGMPLYNLAATIDDARMNITHVIRGEEHLSNTPRQILLYQALGYTVPRFAHLGILLAPDGGKLSKREGAPSLQELRREGYLPEAVIWYLTSLGFTPPPGTPPLLNNLAAVFQLEKVSPAPAVFDQERLRGVNAEFLRRLPVEELWARGRSYLSAEAGEELVRRLVVIKDEVTTLADLPKALSTLSPVPREKLAELLCSEGKEIQELFLFWPRLKAIIERWDFSRLEELQDLVKGLPKELGLKGRQVFHPLRLLLTGREQGPELYRLMWALGKEETLRRLVAGFSLCYRPDTCTTQGKKL